MRTTSGKKKTRGRRKKSLIGLIAWWALGAGCLFSIALVFYASWVPSSRLSEAALIPDWLGSWVDSGGEMSTRRTGLPFVGFGLFLTLAMKLNRIRHAAAISIIGSACLVGTAELIQFFLPARNPAWGDVGWGVAGALAGGVVAFCLLDISDYLLNRK